MQSNVCLPILAALAFSTLAGCSQQAPATTPKEAPAPEATHSDQNKTAGTTIELAPGLPGVGDLNNRDAPNGRYRAIPAEVATALLSLPMAPLQVPRPLLKQILGREGYVVEVSRGSSPPEFRITSIRSSGADYALWVRTFRGQSPDIAGYLVHISAACSQLVGLPSDDTTEAAKRECAKPGRKGLGTGLRAYRIVDGKVEDVTASIRQPKEALGSELYDRYQAAGAGDAFLDDSRLDQVPVGRWIMELDPEQPLAEDAPRAFDRGMLVHAGFFLWNGDHFENRDTVPARLWPCTDRPSECNKEDRYVTADK
ncbi:hypothetical protein [Xanthomonas campestris]|uniref:hypothetical protein n=1 Tax=Xanthomonas campestris TaxID=339 RepID=UPI002B236311|nr:hypothetical protein [Xanthomonas campestris]MEA9659950.1 hypothetical protein [Xanthomonas campestris pv. raphani]MEA9732637.1 hypothetical protein [Xanthomonas campestris]MEA9765527.1 hypothetical protein [Xanthomonas campestris pv. raphani]MEA9817886.1 hypothetical protein [Xanthomonas campestris pv. raphani]MEA9911040.1 hypothetical protein [Xanthomonas campestris pv. raphani]